MLSRLAEFVLRHRKLVILGWLALFVMGGAASGQIGHRLKLDFSLPGQPGQEASNRIVKIYGVEPGDAFLPVVTLPTGQSVAQHEKELAAAFDAIRTENPTYKVVDHSNTHDKAFITNDGRSTYAMVFQPTPKSPADFKVDKNSIKAMTPLLPAGASVKVTNTQLLNNAGDNNNGPNLLLEVTLGGVGALLVLAFVFASFLAFIPIIIAIFSILTTYLLLLGLTYITDVNFIVQFLVGLIGLGVSIDYSLLVVTRWREERDHGKNNHDAVAEAVRTAGHAVVNSAGTVAIGLCALAVLPIPFLRSVGFGGLLIPLVAMFACITFLPAVLGGIGPKVDWPRIRHEDTASKAWTRWAALVVRRRWIAAGIAMSVLVVMMLPFFHIRIGTPRTDSLAKAGPAYEAITTLRNGGSGTGVLTPMSILVKDHDASTITTQASSVPGVATAIAPSGPQWNKDGSHVVFVIPNNETVAGPSTKVVTHVLNLVKKQPGFNGLAGLGAGQIDFIHGVYGNFPMIFGIILLLTFLLLARSFRSVLLPLKAVILNAISLAATYGVVVFVWQWGHGSDAIFGIQATGAITFWVPMMIFAFLFGLSMDYEVFILSRMREEYDRTGSTDTAVVQGIGRTGRLVTSAALVLFLSFLALGSGPGADIKILASALGVGILLDATVVRAVLVPALVSLFGSWNWWMPVWLAKVLRVQASAHESPTALAD